METAPTRPGWWETLPGVLKATAGILTALGGLLVTLNQLGMLDTPRRAGASTPPSVAGAAPTTTTATAPAQAPPATAPASGVSEEQGAKATPSIEGFWRDATGTVYQVRQVGSSFEFVAANQVNGSQSRGSGTIRGTSVETRFITNVPSTGRGTGTISADGRQITGRVYDSALGEYLLALYR